MSNLIVTVIAIVLLVATVLAAAYYGGKALNDYQKEAHASRLLSEAEQIAGSLSMFRGTGRLINIAEDDACPDGEKPPTWWYNKYSPVFDLDAYLVSNAEDGTYDAACGDGNPDAIASQCCPNDRLELDFLIGEMSGGGAPDPSADLERAYMTDVPRGLGVEPWAILANEIRTPIGTGDIAEERCQAARNRLGFPAPILSCDDAALDDRDPCCYTDE